MLAQGTAALIGMSESEEEPRIYYQCMYCGKVFEREKLSKVAETRCPYCGFNVIKKTRGGRTKLVKTSELTKEGSLE